MTVIPFVEELRCFLKLADEYEDALEQATGERAIQRVTDKYGRKLKRAFDDKLAEHLMTPEMKREMPTSRHTYWGETAYWRDKNNLFGVIRLFRRYEYLRSCS